MSRKRGESVGLKVIKLIDKKLLLPSVTIQKCVLYVKEIGHNLLSWDGI
jgi:hypothetical protein